MLILPAVDIRGGRCVRLLQGDYDKETVFGDDPVAMATRWIDEGARALHIVDLDGARDGRSPNRAAVEEILVCVRKRAGTSLTTQLGGGIRNLDDIESWLALGLDRVIIGTAAVETPELVASASRSFAGRVWVGIDARGGKVAVAGWTRTTALDATALARRVEQGGAAGIIFTNIERDGTGTGVDVESVAELADGLHIPVIASGGVHGVEDVGRLLAARRGNICGVIVGRALYEGKVTMAELLAASRDSQA